MLSRKGNLGTGRSVVCAKRDGEGLGVGRMRAVAEKNVAFCLVVERNKLLPGGISLLLERQHQKPVILVLAGVAMVLR